MSFSQVKKSSNLFGYGMLGSSVLLVVLNSLIMNKTISADATKTLNDASDLTTIVHTTFAVVILLFLTSLYLTYNLYYKKTNISIPFPNNVLKYLTLLFFPITFFSLFVVLENEISNSGDKPISENEIFKNIVITILSFTILYLMFSIYMLYKLKEKENYGILCGLYTLDVNPYISDLDKK